MQVWNYMQKCGTELGMETHQMRCVTMALEGNGVSLHNNDTPKLWKYDHFMAVLHEWFEDPLVECKAWT